MADKMSRTEMKAEAQKALMSGIANILAYWKPEDYGLAFPEEQGQEFRGILQREADRVAKMFGYEAAWSKRVTLLHPQADGAARMEVVTTSPSGDSRTFVVALTEVHGDPAARFEPVPAEVPSVPLSREGDAKE